MTTILLNYFKMQCIKKYQVNVGCHTNKQCCPITALFLVKMHVNMQNRSVSYQS